MYAKIKENSLLKYPYEFKDFFEENPHTSPSGDLYSAFQNTEANLSGEVLVEVKFLEAPTYDSKLQNAVQETQPSYVGSEWVIGWSVVPKTQEELAEQEASQVHNVRQQRNRMLSSSDWTQASDSPKFQNTEWLAYRQALRDVTSQSGFPWNVQWPNKPE